MRPALAILAAAMLLIASCSSTHTTPTATAPAGLVRLSPSATLPSMRDWYVTITGQRASLCAVNLATGQRRLLRRNAGESLPLIGGQGAAWMPLSGSPHSLLAVDLLSGTTFAAPPGADVAGFGVDGLRLAWQQNLDGTTSSVLLSDLRTGHTISIGKGSEWAAQPTVSGKWITWEDDQTGTVYLYDAKSGKKQTIVARHGVASSPLVSGDWLVWTESKEVSSGTGPSRIYARNLVSGLDTLVSNSGDTSGDPTKCAMGARWLAWQPRNTSNLRAVNLVTGRQTPLPVVGTDVDGLAIAGDWVVWHVWRGATGLYALNLRTGHRLTLARPGGDNGPQVVGSWVVWNDSVSMDGPTQYRARNLVTGAERAFSL